MAGKLYENVVNIVLGRVEQGDIEQMMVFHQYIERGEVIQMILETRYEENLPSPNYKTRKFSRMIQGTLSEEDAKDKEKVLALAKKQEAMVEALVKSDIARHTAALDAGEQEAGG